METTALTTTQPPSQRALITKEVLKYEAEQRRMLAEYVKEQMVQDVDFGVIPGTPKPSLWKPGAEKLITLFRCTPKFTLMEKMSRQDFDIGFFHYVFRCRIYSRDVDAVVAEGFGSASSYESRYRWRNANRKCPACGKEAIIQGKAEYGGGWVCFKKKDGCGAKFNVNDAAITGQQVGRVENPDLADMANTILKMAKKRALVDGAIALARCSDMFTQDVEDLGPEAPPEDGPPMPPQPEQARGKGQQTRSQQAQGERRAPSPAPRESRPLPTEPAKAEQAAQVGGATPPRTPPQLVVAFGPHKGKLAVELSDEELSETVDLAHDKLLEQPKARWAAAMRENLVGLEAEVARRCAPPAQQLGGQVQDLEPLHVPHGPDGHPLDRECALGQWKGQALGDMSVADLRAAKAWGEEQLADAHVARHHGPGIRQNLAALEAELTLREQVPPTAHEPDSEDEAIADAICAEAEHAETETDVRALSANAKKLPDGPLKARAAAALKTACARLGIQPAKKTTATKPEPGSDG